MEFTKEELAIIITCIRGYRSYSTDLYTDPQASTANRCAASSLLEIMYNVSISDKDILDRYIELEAKIDKEIPPADFFGRGNEVVDVVDKAIQKRLKEKRHLSVVDGNATP